MERKLKAELWDKVHYLFRDYNDRMVHVELRYDYDIDVDAVKTVVMCFLEKDPVLHSQFIDTHISTHWYVMPYKIDDVVKVIEDPDDVEEEINKFLTQYLPPDGDLQIKVAIIKKDGKSVLCIVENHMCMDGGDLKYFMKAFCKNYSDYVEKGISPVDLRKGSRSYEEVYSGFSQTEAKMARGLYKNVSATSDTHRFPLTEDSIKDKSFIAKRKIDSERFLKIKSVGKQLGVTINDVLLGSYFHALYELANYNYDESVIISCAIDLRRHMKSTENEGLTNHTAWMQCEVPRRGKDIFETVKFASEASDRFKNDKFMGLYGLPLLDLGYTILPQAASEEVIKIGYSNPLMAMSNIGILDHEKLALCGNEPYDGFMSGAVKYKPYALVSATSLKNTLTLSMAVRGNDDDRAIVENFFDLMEKYINEFIAG